MVSVTPVTVSTFPYTWGTFLVQLAGARLCGEGRHPQPLGIALSLLNGSFSGRDMDRSKMDASSGCKLAVSENGIDTVAQSIYSVRSKRVRVSEEVLVVPLQGQ